MKESQGARPGAQTAPHQLQRVSNKTNKELPREQLEPSGTQDTNPKAHRGL